MNIWHLMGMEEMKSCGMLNARYTLKHDVKQIFSRGKTAPSEHAS